MTRRQQLTQATIELHQHDQLLDRRDPVVAAFIADCGLATTPVSIKLTGENESDVNLQIQRLKDAFGSLITLTEPRRVSNGVEWIAHGTLLA